MVVVLPTVVVRAPTSPMKATAVVGTALLVNAALDATRTPPVAPMAVW